jgi:hypothetical protein
MLKLKGIYKWQLVDFKTGEIKLSGQQENLITDSILQGIPSYYGSDPNQHQGRIVLSKQAVPLPTAEYREYGAANSAISRDYVSGSSYYTYDSAAGSRKMSNNFSPPASPETFTIFGLDLYVGSWYNFYSFIILTTPVTQLTTQFLYVEYTVSATYMGGLMNTPDNNLINKWANWRVFSTIGEFAYHASSTNTYVKITSKRSPNSINNVGRGIYAISEIEYSGQAPNGGCRYGINPARSFGTTEIPGPIGVPIWRVNLTNYGFFVYGIYDTSLTPSISRVFVHPDANSDQVFSDPANPPVSQASITLSGTPTCKYSLVCRLEITKTGDASDIVDETFTANPTTDELTVSHDDWAVDDVVRFTTTGTLPSPLATGTDYYIVTKSGTSPTVLIEVSLSEGGSVVDITDSGSGTHTITREITGRYKLTLQPCPNSLDSNVVGNKDHMYNIFALDDPSGDADYDQEKDLREFVLIGRYSEYIYTVQYTFSSPRKIMICRQLIGSVESSVPLHSQFGTDDLELWTMARGKGTYANIVYIGTSDGIYKYDLASPATPTLMTITGMLATTVYDLSFDEVTEYLWAGHSTGFSRIDLSTNTAAQYATGSGNPLEGIASSDVDIIPGTVTAHNGFVLWFRFYNDGLWLLQDGVGYAQTTAYYYKVATINKTDGTVVVMERASSSILRWRSISVTGITGINTGVWTTTDSRDWTAGSLNDQYWSGAISQIGTNRFLGFIRNYTYDERIYGVIYNVGSDFQYTYVQFTYNVNLINNIYRTNKERQACNTRVPIDVTENDMDVPVFLQNYGLFNVCGERKFGWSGSAWVLDNVNDRQIIKTGSHSLGHGVSVQFNNAGGADWDKQFVLGERFTFMISPVLIKDNLQEYDVKVRSYYCAAKRVVNWTTTIAATVTVPEAPTGSSPDADFRDLETLDWVIEVYNVTAGSAMTQVASPPGDGEYSVTGLLDGTFEFHANQIGDTVRLTYNYTCYW